MMRQALETCSRVVPIVAVLCVVVASVCGVSRPAWGDTGADRLRVERVYCAEKSCEPAPFEVHFNAPVDASMARKVRMAPQPARWRVVQHKDDPRRLRLEGDFMPGVVYTLRVLGVGYKANVVFRAPEPALAWVTQGDEGPVIAYNGVLPADGEARVGLAALGVADVEVRAWSLTPNDVVQAFRAHYSNISYHFPGGFTGRLLRRVPDVDAAEIKLDPSEAVRWAYRGFDLKKRLGLRRGAALVRAVPKRLWDGKQPKRVRSAKGLWRITNLAVAVNVLERSGTVRVEKLATGEAVVGARVRLVTDRGVDVDLGTTNALGLAVLPSLRALPEARGWVLIMVEAEDGDWTFQRAALPLGGWAQPSSPAVLGTIVTDRSTYVAGDVVQAIGTLVAPYALELKRAGLHVTWAVETWDRSLVHHGEVLRPSGETSARLKLPAEFEGDAWVVLYVDGRVVERRRVRVVGKPSVRLRWSMPEGPLVWGQQSGVGRLVLSPTRPAKSEDTSTLKELIGGGELARYDGTLTCDRVRWRPPGVSAEWQIGPLKAPNSTAGADLRWLGEAKDANGAVERDITLGLGPRSGEDTARCRWYVRLGRDTDTDVSASWSALVHAAPVYLAVQVPQATFDAKRFVDVRVRAVDISGRRVRADRVRVYVGDDGERMRSPDKAEPVCELTLDAQGEDAVCSVPWKLASDVSHVVAELDTASGTVRTTARMRVAPRGGSRTMPWAFVLDADAVRPGEDVVVRVRRRPLGHAVERSGDSPSVRVHDSGWLTVRSERSVMVQPFNVDGGEATIRLKAQSDWGPRAWLSVRLLSATHQGKPGGAFWTLDVRDVRGALMARTHHVRHAKPGATVPVVVQAYDLRGQPVRHGRVALWITSGDVDLTRLTGRLECEPRMSRTSAHSRRALEAPFVPSEDFAGPVGWARGEPVSQPMPWPNACGMRMGSFVARWPSHHDISKHRPDDWKPEPSRVSAWSGETPVWMSGMELDRHGLAVAQVKLPEVPGVYRVVTVVSAPELADVPSRSAYVTPTHSVIHVRE